MGKKKDFVLSVKEDDINKEVAHTAVVSEPDKVEPEVKAEEAVIVGTPDKGKGGRFIEIGGGLRVPASN